MLWLEYRPVKSEILLRGAVVERNVFLSGLDARDSAGVNLLF